MDNTINYYNHNADLFIQETMGLNMGDGVHPFLLYYFQMAQAFLMQVLVLVEIHYILKPRGIRLLHLMPLKNWLKKVLY